MFIPMNGKFHIYRNNFFKIVDFAEYVSWGGLLLVILVLNADRS